jgi:aminoglycoside 3-N-acetyltransferase
MQTIDGRTIVEGLHRLEIPAGSKLLVHSSLSSFGYVAGGAGAVIDAFLEVIGPGGTLLAPTLTGHEGLSATSPPVFDPAAQPGWTGMIPETLRQRPGAVRSLHPTHSVAAVGADAERLTRGHRLSITPCDEFSPYGELAVRDDAYIVLLGVTHESNTTYHHVEEMAGVDYHMQPGLAPATILLDGQAHIRHVMLHRYGTPRNFERLEPVLVERGIQRQTQIGQATVRLVHAASMVRLALRAVAADPRILCASRGDE